MKDYYSILGIEENEKNLAFNELEPILKKKFRALCLQYHPDKQVGKSESEKKGAEEKFKDINEAYSVLSDEKKKQEYDMQLEFGAGGYNYNGMNDLSEFMRQHMADMGFGGGFGNAHYVAKGTDVRIKITCTLEDVYNGISKKIRYNRDVQCPDCHGTGSADGKSTQCPYCNGTGVETIVENNGWMQAVTQTTCRHCNGSGRTITSPCKKCSGTGLVSMPETVEFNIPTDIRNNYQLTIRGKGNEAPNGDGIPGNLCVVFSVSDSQMYGICENNYDLYCKTNVGILDCLTGCKKEVKCIDGTKTEITIPKGCRHNEVVKVSGKGMPKPQYGYGDMLVYVQQVMPTSLNDKEIEKINELKQMKHFKK